MMRERILLQALASLLLLVPIASAETRAEQNEVLFRTLQEVHGLSDAQMARVREIFAGSIAIGQGNPAVTRHPLTEQQCRERVSSTSVDDVDANFARICDGPFMAPLFDPVRERPQQALACIDQFEFPDVPCTYPVIWVRAREAALLCEAVGKRLCDAHEWESACEGRLEDPDYRFDLAAGRDPASAVKAMRDAHNRAHAASKKWSYGDAYERGVCAAASSKSEGCDGGNYARCGSNTYPSGSFPACRSALGVYDLNGNAAEHMNLPLSAEQMASRGSRELGVTEMKGSWFIFDGYRAHEDWCRWRAPYWHGSRVMDPESHHNYHLGFRCCRSLGGAAE